MSDDLFAVDCNTDVVKRSDRDVEVPVQVHWKGHRVSVAFVLGVLLPCLPFLLGIVLAQIVAGSVAQSGCSTQAEGCAWQGMYLLGGLFIAYLAYTIYLGVLIVLALILTSRKRRSGHSVGIGILCGILGVILSQITFGVAHIPH